MKTTLETSSKNSGNQSFIHPAARAVERSTALPPEMDLTPISRRPIKLPDTTVQSVLAAPLPLLPAVDGDSSKRAAFKRASIVIVTFNNLVFTKMCLSSLLANTQYAHYEIILVDNGSTDGTAAYLRALARQYHHVRVLLNGSNRGFAPATNQGLAIARGDILVLLNNDTLVPPGWLTRLIRHLQDPATGLVGPLTNRIGNEAEIDTSYHTYKEFLQFAGQYSREHEGQRFDIGTLCMFCLAMRREVYEQIGVLDERFEMGMLEDDDYCRRVHLAGRRVVCAEDVFVHHFGQASFGQLIPTGEYGKLIVRNRRRFQEKWGVAWQPYQRRSSGRYLQLSDRIRAVVQDIIPADAAVIVVSKGDDALLELDGRPAWHFPQSEDGVFAGYYPADSAAAIAHLEALRARGGDFLLFPNTAYWWLDHYVEFKQHLEQRYQLIVNHEDTCLIFSLRDV